MTNSTHPDFRFSHRLQARWGEMDSQKNVSNAHYLMYFETALADYLRALALPYDLTLQALEGALHVKKVTLEFLAPARLDDALDVALKCSRVDSTSLVFTGVLFRASEPLVGGELVYVFTDPATQTPKPVPAVLRDILMAYEGWEPMVRVELGTWHDLGPAASQVRTEVFVNEQSIPADLEWDDADATAVHALARNRLGLPVATGRLLQQAPGVSRIGRMAVSRELRGAHVGHAVLRALMQAATDRGDHQVVLHAQRSAEGFYARLGFLPRGEPFEEAGIVHIEMVHTLPAGLR